MCAVLLVVGGNAALTSIQTATVVMAFPFMTITVLLMISMLKELVLTRKDKSAGG